MASFLERWRFDEIFNGFADHVLMQILPLFSAHESKSRQLRDSFLTSRFSFNSLMRSLSFLTCFSSSSMSDMAFS